MLIIIPLFAALALAEPAPEEYFAQGTVNVHRSPTAEESYERGQEALRNNRWEDALKSFSEIQKGNARADGALYWKAYALNKLGRRSEALGAIAEMKKSYGSSRWANDAAALELEIKQAGGQTVSPDAQQSEDLKLLALNSLMASDPARALPTLEKILASNNSPKVKERALFVLAQSGTPQARAIMAKLARGEGNPDLQLRAIDNLGLFGGKEGLQVLSEIFSAGDAAAKRRVLHAMMIAGDRQHLLKVAKMEKDPQLVEEAIHQLGICGGVAELAELYGTTTTTSAKKAIIHAMFIGGAAERLGQLARGEKDPQARLEAVRSLGLMGKKTAPDLLAIYHSEQDKAVRKAVLKALFLQGNSSALIEIARKESDTDLKTEAVRNLSLIGNKESAAFMEELLK